MFVVSLLSIIVTYTNTDTMTRRKNIIHNTNAPYSGNFVSKETKSEQRKSTNLKSELKPKHKSERDECSIQFSIFCQFFKQTDFSYYLHANSCEQTNYNLASHKFPFLWRKTVC